jgi:helicase
MKEKREKTNEGRLRRNRKRRTTRRRRRKKKEDQEEKNEELVGHDTDPYDLARTTIPLTTLGEWCSRIPSRRLLIVLDCCFSGGMGAKALQVEAGPRDIQSVDGKLNQISGEGRVVLTASGPTQKAWESPKLGHGFLTLHLVEGLQGPEEIREGGRIAVLRLLDYVVGRLVDSARQMRNCRDTFSVELLLAS